MATQTGKSERKRSQPLGTYFILDGEVHRRLHIQPGADILTAWNYPRHKRMGYNYTEVKRRAEIAYTTKEVCKMINRTRPVLENAILDGNVPAPQKTYYLSGNGFKQLEWYRWGEKDIFAAWEYFCTVHRGRPRKDGLITPAPLPTAAELRAMIRQEIILYTKTEDGDFVPSWRAEGFS